LVVAALGLLGEMVAAQAEGPAPADHRGRWFLGLTEFGEFQSGTNREATAVVLLSPVFEVPIAWTELIASWNADLRPGQWLSVAAAAGQDPLTNRFYSFGTWSLGTKRPARTSVRGQKDRLAQMQTDTLLLRAPARQARLRLTLGGGATVNQFKFVGLSFHGEHAGTDPLPPNRAAWGRLLPVPERSQMAYKQSKKICSPTTVSMLLSYWAGELSRPELGVDVPVVCDGVHDPGWRGFGNWAFNMAYVGSFPGLRGYVTRVSDLAEVEDWIVAGIPVGLSVCYNKLRGKSDKPNGHLVVCVGFTENGDVIVNDGGTRENVRKTFPREALLRAWAHSKNAVYLVYPEDARVPPDRFGHWHGG
jgi:hypothetical protein